MRTDGRFDLTDDDVALQVALYLLKGTSPEDFLKGKEPVEASYTVAATNEDGITFTLEGELVFTVEATYSDYTISSTAPEAVYVDQAAEFTVSVAGDGSGNTGYTAIYRYEITGGDYKLEYKDGEVWKELTGGYFGPPTGFELTPDWEATTNVRFTALGEGTYNMVLRLETMDGEVLASKEHSIEAAVEATYSSYEISSTAPEAVYVDQAAEFTVSVAGDGSGNTGYTAIYRYEITGGDYKLEYKDGEVWKELTGGYFGPPTGFELTPDWEATTNVRFTALGEGTYNMVLRLETMDGEVLASKEHSIEAAVEATYSSYEISSTAPEAVYVDQAAEFTVSVAGDGSGNTGYTAIYRYEITGGDYKLEYKDGEVWKELTGGYFGPPTGFELTPDWEATTNVRFTALGEGTYNMVLRLETMDGEVLASKEHSIEAAVEATYSSYEISSTAPEAVYVDQAAEFTVSVAGDGSGNTGYTAIYRYEITGGDYKLEYKDGEVWKELTGGYFGPPTGFELTPDWEATTNVRFTALGEGTYNMVLRLETMDGEVLASKEHSIEAAVEATYSSYEISSTAPEAVYVDQAAEFTVSVAGDGSGNTGYTAIYRYEITGGDYKLEYKDGEVWKELTGGYFGPPTGFELTPDWEATTNVRFTALGEGTYNMVLRLETMDGEVLASKEHSIEAAVEATYSSYEISSTAPEAVYVDQAAEFTVSVAGDGSGNTGYTAIYRYEITGGDYKLEYKDGEVWKELTGGYFGPPTGFELTPDWEATTNVRFTALGEGTYNMVLRLETMDGEVLASKEHSIEAAVEATYSSYEISSTAPEAVYVDQAAEFTVSVAGDGSGNTGYTAIYRYEITGGDYKLEYKDGEVWKELTGGYFGPPTGFELTPDWEATTNVRFTALGEGTYNMVLRLETMDGEVLASKEHSIEAAVEATYSSYEISSTAPEAVYVDQAAEFTVSVAGDGSGNTGYTAIYRYEITGGDYKLEYKDGEVWKELTGGYFGPPTGFELTPDWEATTNVRFTALGEGTYNMVLRLETMDGEVLASKEHSIEAAVEATYSSYEISSTAPEAVYVDQAAEFTVSVAGDGSGNTGYTAIYRYEITGGDYKLEYKDGEVWKELTGGYFGPPTGFELTPDWEATTNVRFTALGEGTYNMVLRLETMDGEVLASKEHSIEAAVEATYSSYEISSTAPEAVYVDQAAEFTVSVAGDGSGNTGYTAIYRYEITGGDYKLEYKDGEVWKELTGGYFGPPTGFELTPDWEATTNVRFTALGEGTYNMVLRLETMDGEVLASKEHSIEAAVEATYSSYEISSTAPEAVYVDQAAEFTVSVAGDGSGNTGYTAIYRYEITGGDYKLEYKDGEVWKELTGGYFGPPTGFELTPDWEATTNVRFTALGEGTYNMVLRLETMDGEVLASKEHSIEAAVEATYSSYEISSTAPEAVYVDQAAEFTVSVAGDGSGNTGYTAIYRYEITGGDYKLEYKDGEVWKELTGGYFGPPTGFELTPDWEATTNVRFTALGEGTYNMVLRLETMDGEVLASKEHSIEAAVEATYSSYEISSTAPEAVYVDQAAEFTVSVAGDGSGNTGYTAIYRYEITGGDYKLEYKDGEVWKELTGGYFGPPTGFELTPDWEATTNVRFTALGEGTYNMVLRLETMDGEVLASKEHSIEAAVEATYSSYEISSTAPEAVYVDQAAEFTVSVAGDGSGNTGYTAIYRYEITGGDYKLEYKDGEVWKELTGGYFGPPTGFELTPDWEATTNVRFTALGEGTYNMVLRLETMDGEVLASKEHSIEAAVEATYSSYEISSTAPEAVYVDQAAEFTVSVAGDGSGNTGYTAIYRYEITGGDYKLEYKDGEVWKELTGGYFGPPTGFELTPDWEATTNVRFTALGEGTYNMVLRLETMDGEVLASKEHSIEAAVEATYSSYEISSTAPEAVYVDQAAEFTVSVAGDGSGNTGYTAIYRYEITGGDYKLEYKDGEVWKELTGGYFGPPTGFELTPDWEATTNVRFTALGEGTYNMVLRLETMDGEVLASKEHSIEAAVEATYSSYEISSTAPEAVYVDQAAEFTVSVAGDGSGNTGYTAIYRYEITGGDYKLEYKDGEVWKELTGGYFGPPTGFELTPDWEATTNVRFTALGEGTYNMVLRLETMDGEVLASKEHSIEAAVEATYSSYEISSTAPEAVYVDQAAEFTVSVAGDGSGNTGYTAIYRYEITGGDYKLEYKDGEVWKELTGGYFGPPTGFELTPDWEATTNVRFTALGEGTYNMVLRLETMDGEVLASKEHSIEAAVEATYSSYEISSTAPEAVYVDQAAEFTVSVAGDGSGNTGYTAIYRYEITGGDYKLEYKDGEVWKELTGGYFGPPTGFELTPDWEATTNVRFTALGEGTYNMVLRLETMDGEVLASKEHSIEAAVEATYSSYEISSTAPEAVYVDQAAEFTVSVAGDGSGNTGYTAIYRYEITGGDYKLEYKDGEVWKELTGGYFGPPTGFELTPDWEATTNVRFTALGEGTYNMVLRLETMDGEVLASKEHSIEAAVEATYSSYEISSTAPEAVYVDQAAEFTVSVAGDGSGNTGYTAIYRYEITGGDYKLEYKDGEVWKELTGGYFGPPTGFELTPDWEATTNVRFTALGEGTYNMVLRLETMDGEVLASKEHSIEAAVEATYSSYEISSTAPEAVYVDQAAEFTVSVAGDGSGNTGYTAIYRYEITGGDYKLEYKDGEVWKELTGGYFGPPTGFELTPDWEATTNVRFTALGEGTYNMVLRLETMDGEVLASKEHSIEAIAKVIVLEPNEGGTTVVQGAELEESEVTLSSNYNAAGLKTFISLAKDDEAVNFDAIFEEFNLATKVGDGEEEGPYNMVCADSSFQYGPSGGFAVEAGVDQVTITTGKVKADAPVGTYVITTEVKAGEEVLATAAYTLVVEKAPVPSTYDFSYEVPIGIVAGEEVEVEVIFATVEEGDFGYDGVRFAYEVTSAPEGATVTFTSADGQVKDLVLGQGGERLLGSGRRV
jgi:hypothetical protein